MKKITILLIVCLLLISCKEKKVEFVESKVIKGFFVVKNLPKEDSLLQNQLVDFVVKNPKIPNDSSIHFYSDNSDTRYFLDQLPDPGGFSSHELEDIEDYNIAKLFFIKCKNDSSKFIGELYYKGLHTKGSRYIKIDTIVNKCN
ncbi:hypothetical protein [Chryseobacterium sp.]|jgi:hypothetical protein|uniref:hypothetical protein n=1 Tax=Chryseobacterium sp. TaxID=1871047 RepID=UPI00284D0B9F|nr:hypothetical protein [Chryseobacterium sp.]MDR3025152.1 hypothetical protein [Chryseobacterium sp.]